MTVEQVKAVIDDADEFSVEPPKPLRRELTPPDPFPIEGLGSVLRPAAEAIHQKIQAPLAICGQSVLAAAALATQGHADVELPTGQERPISGYFVTVAASGERKTSVDSEALRPIRKHERNLRAQYDSELPSFQNSRDAWTKQREQIFRSKKDYPDLESKRAALELLGPAPAAPLHPLVVSSEPTFEGLERLFAIGQPSMGVFSSEGGQFIGGHGMRADTKLRSAAALSAMWDGVPISRVRATEGAIVLPGRRLAVHLMAQPDVANILLADRLLADQGLLSRLLISAPLTTAGTRLWQDPRLDSEHTIRRYECHLLGILEKPLPLADTKANELSPPRMTMSPAARRTWIGFSDHIERAMTPGGPFERINAFANKLAEQAARSAAVLSCIADIDSNEISVAAMDAGIALAEHYASEGLRLLDRSAVRPEILRAEKVLKWLLDSWTGELVSLPDIYQRGPYAIGDKAAAGQAVKTLEEHGWLSRLDQGGVVQGKRRRDVWRIWGKVP